MWRRFPLPASIDPQNIRARYDNGVLTVTLPKSERAKPRQIPVESTGSGPRRGEPQVTSGSSTR